jgi:hypothetical protein
MQGAGEGGKTFDVERVERALEVLKLGEDGAREERLGETVDEHSFGGQWRIQRSVERIF